MSKELLSVIVPIYNVEDYLEQCIDSILQQTYTYLDILLVDDGSTDKSGEICDAYAEKDKRIRVIHKENGGLLAARITGVEQAMSEYVTFVDSDDWIMPQMYEKLMGIMMQEKVDLVTSGCVRYYQDRESYINIDDYEEGYYDKEAIEHIIVPKMLWNGKYKWALDPSMCLKIFKKNLLWNIYKPMMGEKVYYGEDTLTIYPYILSINSLYCTHNVFYYHRQRPKDSIPAYVRDEDYYNKVHEVYLFLKTEFEKEKQADDLLKQLDVFYMRSVLLRSLIINAVTKGMSRTMHLFPANYVKKHARIVLYGAGVVGQQYYEQVDRTNYCEVVAWVDKDEKKHNHMVSPVDSVKELNYDYIVIALSSEQIRREVRDELVSKGIAETKIVWEKI